MSGPQPGSPSGAGVVSGIHTDPLLAGEPPSFWVTWIDWDSDFRRELRLNDKIVGVNGESLGHLLQPHETHRGVGQSGEGQYWTGIGAVAAQEIALSILRDEQPMTVRGRLGSTMSYHDREGKQALAPGGPARMSRDTFGSTWAIWFEKLQFTLSHFLTRGWTDKIPTRTELALLLEHGPRIEFLLATYPGPFAQAMHDDWTRAVESFRGKKADPPVDLEYRSIGEKRVALAKTEARKAWQAVLDETANVRIPAAPAVSPLAREQAVGKVIELPAISNRNIVNDMGKTIAAVGSPSDGYWFLLLDRPEFHEFYQVLYRYQGQVNPQVAERYRYLVRVLDDAWMFTVRGRPAPGLTLQPIAALAGEDELFVDLRRSPPRFAGEDALSVFASIPRDDTSPRSVIEAMIQAVKTGDEKTWRSLFAPWRSLAGGSGRTIIDPAFATDPRMFASEWDRSRRGIMGEVHDARVSHVEKVRRILSRDAEHGLPDVDQAVVWVDHYGLFDGEHRTFQHAGVNRRWPLQRLDGGPWRISAIQTL